VAHLEVEGNELLLRLTWREKVMGFHGNIRVSLSAIRSVSAPENAWIGMRGWRMAGFAVPGLIAMGTRRHADGYDFTAVRKQRPVVQVDINGPPRWQRLVVSVPEGVDPREEADAIAEAAGIARS
jgi:hypothetical protein